METENLCKGFPFCPNKADLKFCKNATSWNLSTGWEPILFKNHLGSEPVSCNNLYYPNNQSLRGQLIEAVNSNDGKVYNCLNRLDENPFEKAKAASRTEAENWLNLFSEGND